VDCDFYIGGTSFLAQLGYLSVHRINLLDLVEPWVFRSKKFEKNFERVSTKIVTGSMVIPMFDSPFQTLLTELVIDRLILLVTQDLIRFGDSCEPLSEISSVVGRVAQRVQLQR